MLKTFRVFQETRRFCADRRGVSGVEFAIILPFMLLLFGVTVELSNAFALNRKVTLAAHTLSDLISQATSVTDADLTGSFSASSQILAPYSAVPVKAIISEVKIDDKGKATIAWTQNQGYDPAKPPRVAGQVVVLPTALAVPSTYLIWGEVNYEYTPIISYISSASIPLGNQFFTRPRQSTCVLFETANCP